MYFLWYAYLTADMMWMFEILRAFLSLLADTNLIKSSGEYRKTFLVLNGSKCFVNSSALVKKPLVILV